MKMLLITLIMSINVICADDFSSLLDEEKRTIHIYHKTVPSVVNVSNIKVADSFFYGKVEVPQGAGTGFVWDDKGHIVTNYHVVQGGNSFVITFHNN
jgi:S1-C subfamily serine protease